MSTESIMLPGPERQSWDSYFMKIAHEASTRGTCDRKKVGCVLVRDRRIIATGYNGSIPGALHCDEVGHDMDEGGHCVRTVHAEANAIAQAARFGTPLLGAVAYVNTFPCWPCFKLLVTAGVRVIAYDAEYRRDARVEGASRPAATVDSALLLVRNESRHAVYLVTTPLA